MKEGLLFLKMIQKAKKKRKLVVVTSKHQKFDASCEPDKIIIFNIKRENNGEA